MHDLDYEKSAYPAQNAGCPALQRLWKAWKEFCRRLLPGKSHFSLFFGLFILSAPPTCPTPISDWWPAGTSASVVEAAVEVKYGDG